MQRRIEWSVNLLARNTSYSGWQSCAACTHVVLCAQRDRPVEYMWVAWIPMYDIIHLVQVMHYRGTTCINGSIL